MTPKAQSGQSKTLAEKLDSIFVDYETSAELTSEGKYRCRDCGMLFETLEEHDLHCRRVHCGEAMCSFSGALM